jgi:hypothetical protein
MTVSHTIGQHQNYLGRLHVLHSYKIVSHSSGVASHSIPLPRCTPRGELEMRTLARSHKSHGYRLARKAAWGDMFGYERPESRQDVRTERRWSKKVILTLHLYIRQIEHFIPPVPAPCDALV